MQTMNISLPEQLKEFIDEQVGSGRYSSVSEYVRDLVRNDEKRKAQEKLESMLMASTLQRAPRPEVWPTRYAQRPEALEAVGGISHLYVAHRKPN